MVRRGLPYLVLLSCVQWVTSCALPLGFMLTPPNGDVAVEDHTIEAAGLTWRYTIRIPNGLADETRAPVVIVLHGTSDTGINQLTKNGWNFKAPPAGFIVVAPTAQPLDPARPFDFLTNPTSWNAGQPYLAAARAEVDDMAFIDALLDELVARDDIDGDNIFIAGYSAGGAMAYRIAAERAERVCGIAVVSSPCWLDDPQPAAPVPTLFMVGARDPIYPLWGGSRNLFWTQRTTTPVVESLDKWAIALGCAPGLRPFDDSEALAALGLAESGEALLTGPLPDSPDDSLIATTLAFDRGRVWAASYECGAGPSKLLALILEGHGHRWPGGRTPEVPEFLIGPDNPPIDATDVILRFFGTLCAEPE